MRRAANYRCAAPWVHNLNSSLILFSSAASAKGLSVVCLVLPFYSNLWKKIQNLICDVCIGKGWPDSRLLQLLKYYGFILIPRRQRLEWLLQSTETASMNHQLVRLNTSLSECRSQYRRSTNGQSQPSGLPPNGDMKNAAKLRATTIICVLRWPAMEVAFGRSSKLPSVVPTTRNGQHFDLVGFDQCSWSFG